MSEGALATTDQNSRAVKPMPELSMDIIKKYICPKATDQEAYTFLQLCKAQNLNPFLREAYLIKYGDEAATIVTGKETFTKRADRLPQYDGFKAGIILLSNGVVVYREGSFFTSSETLLGGWAEVYRKDRSIPFRNEVKLEEYIGKKKDGSITKMWQEKAGTMIRKVALMQSLREAFPDEFGGLYSPEEISSVDMGALPTYQEGKAPQVQPPDTAKKADSVKKATNTGTEEKTNAGAAGDEAITAVVDNVIKAAEAKKPHAIIADAKKFTFFSDTILKKAQELKGKSAVISFVKKGNFYNCTGVAEPAPADTRNITVPENCPRNPMDCEFSSFVDDMAICTAMKDTECPCKG